MDMDVMGLAGGPKMDVGCSGPFQKWAKDPNLEKPSNLEMVGYLVCRFRTFWYIYFDVLKDEENVVGECWSLIEAFLGCKDFL